MTPEEKQRIFDAINSSIETHAREIAPDRRIAIATDAALKVVGLIEATEESEHMARRAHDER